MLPHLPLPDFVPRLLRYLLIAAPIMLAFVGLGPHTHKIVLTLLTPNSLVIQTFCDDGGGFREATSSLITTSALSQRGSPFIVPLSVDCRRIRIDFGNNDSTLELLSATLISNSGIETDLVPNIHAGQRNDVRIDRRAGPGGTILTAVGADPYVVLAGDFYDQTHTTLFAALHRDEFISNLAATVLVLLAVLAGLGLVEYFAARRHQSDGSRRPSDRLYLLVFAASISAFYMLVMARMTSGLFINAYPFLSSDSFDYLFEGLALQDLLFATTADTWPTLRNPGYVLVAFIDAVLGANGKAVIVVQGLAIFTILASILWAGKYFGHSALVIAACMFGVAYMPLGYVYFYVLSDTLCIALMMASVAILMRDRDAKQPVFPVLAFVFALAAGLTQTYGMIPFVAIVGSRFIERLISDRRPDWLLAASVVALLTLWFVLQQLWETVIPHTTRPTTFSLLQFSTDMSSFYFHVWIIAFVPLVPVLFALAISQRSVPDPGDPWIKLLAPVLCFAGLSFFYQWPDSRFTFLYVPLLIIVLLAASRASGQATATRFRSRALAASMILYGILGITLAPANYWQPRLSTLEFAPHNSWLGQALLSKPKDRFQLQAHCGNTNSLCANAVVPASTPYENTMLSAYKALSLSRKRRDSAGPG